MCRYSEFVKAHVSSRISSPHRQSVPQISAELRIYVVTLYSLRMALRLEWKVLTASQKDPEGWGRPTNSRWP